MQFISLSGCTADIDGMMQQLYLFMQQEPQYQYKLMLGSDSQRYGTNTLYVTAVVLHRVGKYAKVWYTQQVRNHNNRIDLSVRIMNETLITVEVLEKIENSILVQMIGRENISVHIDAGMQGDSRKIITSCTGIIKAYMINYETKPNSLVASHVADKFTRMKRKRRKKVL